MAVGNYPIPDNQFLCVTGDPRSGTSLMMRTLYLLGIDVAGDKFPQEKRGRYRQLDRPNLRLDPEKKAELEEEWAKELAKTKNMNPKGFYEVSGTVMQGTQDIEDFGGKALKIISPGAYPRGEQGTPEKLIYKWIWCLRNPQSVSQSQTELKGDGLQVAGADGWTNPDKPCNPRRFMVENGGLVEYFLENPESMAKVLVIDYDDMIDFPRETIKRVADFLGVEVTEGAVDNVDPSLRRSKAAFKGYNEQNKAIGELADDFYSAAKEADLVGLRAVCDKAEATAIAERLDRTPWYDPGTGCYAPGIVHDRLATDFTYRKEWLDGKGRARREFRQGLHPQCSPAWQGEAEEEYSLDLGSRGILTRKKVIYNNETMTWEQAFLKHQKRWNDGKTQILPLAKRVALADGLK